MSTTTTETWDARWTASHRAIAEGVGDTIFDESPTLDRMFRRDAIKTITGGKEIQENLMYAKNNLQYWAGYDELNNNAVDGITAAHFKLRNAQVPITISWEEEQENSGSAQVFDLLNQKTTQAMKTAMTGVNEGGYGAQTGLSFLGRQDIIAADPTTGTLGGINRASATWWRNQTNASGGNFNNKTGDFYDGLTAMGTMYNNCSDGNILPTNIWTTLTLYGEYEAIFESTGYARVTAGEVGFSRNDTAKPKFRNAVVNYDRACPTGKMYFDNYKFYCFKVQRGAKFQKTKFKENANQMAKVAYIILRGQYTTNNPRRLGQIDFT